MTPSPSTASSRSGRQPVPVDDLEIGMVLAEDVHDLQGRLLLPKGTVLTDRHLRAFQMLGVLALKVRGVGEEEAVAPVVSPEILAEAEARIVARMGQQDLSHPAIAEIVRFAVQREARIIAATAHPHA